MGSRKEEYLAEAARAEEKARHATIPDIRESWLKIAALYRELAQEQRDPPK
jgi:hypothetical protein